MKETKQQRQAREAEALATERERQRKESESRQRREVLADPYSSLLAGLDRDIRHLERSLEQALSFLHEREGHAIRQGPLYATRLPGEAAYAARVGVELSAKQEVRRWVAQVREEWLAAKSVNGGER